MAPGGGASGAVGVFAQAHSSKAANPPLRGNDTSLHRILPRGNARKAQRTATLPVKVRLAAQHHYPHLSINPDSPARQALSHPDFSRYAFGRFSATLAWQMINVMLGFQMWKITGNQWYLGFIGLAQFLPFVVLLLPGGQIADRFDRRLIIALAYGLELAAAVALLVFTLSGSTEVMFLFVIAALLGVARASGRRPARP